MVLAHMILSFLSHWYELSFTSQWVKLRFWEQPKILSSTFCPLLPRQIFARLSPRSVCPSVRLTCHRPWQFVGSVPGFCWFLSPLATCCSGPGHSSSGCRGNISSFSGNGATAELIGAPRDAGEMGVLDWAGLGDKVGGLWPGVPLLHLVYLLDLPSHLVVFIPRRCYLVSSIKPSSPLKQGSRSFPKALETPPCPNQARSHIWTQEVVHPRAPRHCQAVEGGCSVS